MLEKHWLRPVRKMITPQYEAGNESRCGECMECAEICPANAVSGKNRIIGTDRDEFFNAMECHQFIIEFGKSIGRSEVSCGRCIKACPLTKKYIRQNIKNNNAAPASNMIKFVTNEKL